MPGRVLILLFVCAPVARAAEPVSFRRDIAPILLNNCHKCHGPEKAKGNYRLDSFARLTTPGESKSAPITPKLPDKSHLFQLLTTPDEDDRMPSKADPLPAPQIALVKRWIEEGATYDAPDKNSPLASIAPDTEHPAAPEIYRQAVPITALAFSPDGKTLAASGYHEVTLWDPNDGKLLGRIPKLAQRTYGLAFSPDGTTLAVAGGTPGRLGELRLCDPVKMTAGKVLDRIPDVMLAVGFSPDGAHIAAGGSDNLIRIYDAQSAKRERVIEQHADWITALAFSPDSSQLVSASRDKSARVFDVNTGAMKSAFLDHQDAVVDVAWNGDGKSVFSVGRDRKIRLWNTADDKQIAQIAAGPADISRLQLGMGQLFAACADGAVRAYSIEKREITETSPAGEYAYAIATDPKNERLAVGRHNGEVATCRAAHLRPSICFVAAPGLLRKDAQPDKAVELRRGVEDPRK
jgi:WD40 repeat protein